MKTTNERHKRDEGKNEFIWYSPNDEQTLMLNNWQFYRKNHIQMRKIKYLVLKWDFNGSTKQ